jgi:uncharacterized protein
MVRAVTFVAALVLLIAALPMVERYFIFFPQREMAGVPPDALRHEEVRLTTEDGVAITSWFVPGDSETAILWFHGNAGNISHRIPLLERFHQELGTGILLVGYRGYGDSEGSPSEDGFYLDARAARSWLAERFSPDRIVYFGQSLGAAVAADLATTHPPYRLVLESAFTSVPAMARRHYPFLPVWPLLRTRFDTKAKIGAVDSPVLLIHGSEDDIVPPEMAEELHEAASDPKRTVVVEGAGHNDVDLVGGADYFEAIRDFIAP